MTHPVAVSGAAVSGEAVFGNAMPAADRHLWDRIDQVVELAPNVDALRWHRVSLIAARGWRARGRELPLELVAAERGAALMHLAADVLVRKVSAACDGPLVLMKGPEVAARYPDPRERWFGDLDFLVGDALAARRALLAAGFYEIGALDYYADYHHVAPLAWPGLPLIIELHQRAHCPYGLAPPPTAELLKLTVPSVTGIAGVLAPTPAAHAVLLALHAWAHEPLGRLGDLIDVAALLTSADRDDADHLARIWGCERLWRTTLAVTEALLTGGGRSLSLHLWARHLRGTRERTVLEGHLRDFAGAICSLPTDRPLAAVRTGLRRVRARHGEERWTDKLHRSRLAIAHAFTPVSEHDRILVADGHEALRGLQRAETVASELWAQRS